MSKGRRAIAGVEIPEEFGEVQDPPPLDEGYVQIQVRRQLSNLQERVARLERILSTLAGPAAPRPKPEGEPPPPEPPSGPGDQAKAGDAAAARVRTPEEGGDEGVSSGHQ